VNQEQNIVEPIEVATTSAEEIIIKNPMKSCIGIEDFAKLDVRIGTIVACEPVAGSDKLLKSQVDFGQLGIRQVLSGIAQTYKAEDMIGKQTLFVINLKPRKMMGHESHGMMLLTSDDLVGLTMLNPIKQITPGSLVG